LTCGGAASGGMTGGGVASGGVTGGGPRQARQHPRLGILEHVALAQL